MRSGSVRTGSQLDLSATAFRVDDRGIHRSRAAPHQDGRLRRRAERARALEHPGVASAAARRRHCRRGGLR